MSERLEAFARRIRDVQKWKVLYGEKQRLLGKSLKNSTRLMIELIQLGRRKPVCTENSSSDIMVMQSAKDRVGMDTSSSLNWARERRVLI